MKPKIYPAQLLQLLLIFLSFLLLPPASGQLPSATTLFKQMNQNIRKIRTVSYKLYHKQVYSAVEDSVHEAISSVWVERRPEDTVFGALLHVQQESKTGRSDYYYDGTSAIDISHTHVLPEKDSSITIMEPFRLPGGAFAPHSFMTVAFGYSKELLATQPLERWAPFLSEMRVADDGNHWVLSWKEQIAAEEIDAQYRLHISKEDGLIRQLFRYTTQRGMYFKTEIKITNLRVNHNPDADSIRLACSYPEYKVSYVNRTNWDSGSRRRISLLTGTKIKEFTYPKFGGGIVTIMPQKGRLLLLDFWETWCGGCFIAMPKIRRLWEQYKDKGLDVVAVVTENQEQAKKVITNQKFPYPTVFGDAQILNFFKLEARPHYILIDESGTIVSDAGSNLEQIQEEIGKRLQ